MKTTALSFRFFWTTGLKLSERFSINVRKVSITSFPIKINLSSKGNAYFLNETVGVLIKNKPQTAVINILNLFTAVCVLFLIKLQWPKNKSIYDTVFVLYGCSLALSESYIQYTSKIRQPAKKPCSSDPKSWNLKQRTVQHKGLSLILTE